MNQAQGPMGMNNNLVYFYENQVVVTFHSELSPDALKRSIRRDWHSTYVQLLNDGLKKDANTSQLTLKPFAESDIPRTQRKMRHDLTDLPGVYVFHTPTGTGTKGTVVAFFHIVPDMPSTQQNGGTGGMGTMGATDTTSQVIKLILSLNGTAVVSLHHNNISAIAAGPHWFTSSVAMRPLDETTHGCPVIPPLPVLESPPSGLWQITPQFSDDAMNDSTGEGVTVFVLDTLPKFEQIADAANAAGSSNLLLQVMASGMTGGEEFESAYPPAINVHYLENLPDPTKTPVTGKDINGNLVGFPMVDHGLFVAGIVRDLAPDADIECIRVLNDFGVGNTVTLTGVLYQIQNRMLEGDLQDTSVVINLSLVIMPPNDNLSQVGLDVGADRDVVNQIHDELLTPMQSLAALGAIFVASVGNDSDPRDLYMNPTGGHFVARYPAYFANDADAVTAAAIIPVGAVNQSGEAASYSNYPGPHGVATYAGEIPQFITKSPTPDDPNDATVVPPVDALRGVYSSAHYPFSYKLDNTVPPESYPVYPAPNSNAWAYWMGTSFATPIISGLAACVLETQPISGDSVRRAIISAATGQAMWAKIQPYSQGMEASNESASVPVIMAAQE